MTVASLTNSALFASPGATLVFPYTFRIFADADLVVQKIATATGVVTTLTLTSDYTVSGSGSYSGGNVTLGVAVGAGYQLLISRNPEAVQNTSWDKSYQSPIEAALDLVTMKVQALEDQLARCIKTSPFDATTEADLTLPAAATRASKALTFSAAGKVQVT